MLGVGRERFKVDILETIDYEHKEIYNMQQSDMNNAFLNGFCFTAC